MHTSIAICSNLSLDDEPVASRTSISADAKLNALSMDIASVHEVSLGMKASVLSDSLVYMNSYMLGSTRFSLYAEYEAQLSSFLIGGAFGLGYGLSLGILNIFLGILGCLVVAGIVFGLLYAMGQPPFLGKNADEIKASVMGGLNDITGKGGEDAAGQTAGAQASQQDAADGQTYQKAYQDQPDQGQPYQGAGAPQGYGRGRLQTDRSLVTYILLSIITCGIYSYYFLYMLARDVNTVCEGDGQETPGLLPFILLSFVTCGFYALYWYYCLGNRLASNAPRYGLNFQENGTTILLWYLVGAFLCGIGPYVAMHFLIRNTNSLCAAYNQYNGL